MAWPVLEGECRLGPPTATVYLPCLGALAAPTGESWTPAVDVGVSHDSGSGSRGRDLCARGQAGRQAGGRDDRLEWLFACGRPVHEPCRRSASTARRALEGRPSFPIRRRRPDLKHGGWAQGSGGGCHATSATSCPVSATLRANRPPDHALSAFGRDRPMARGHCEVVAPICPTVPSPYHCTCCTSQPPVLSAAIVLLHMRVVTASC